MEDSFEPQSYVSNSISDSISGEELNPRNEIKALKDLGQVLRNNLEEEIAERHNIRVTSRQDQMLFKKNLEIKKSALENEHTRQTFKEIEQLKKEDNKEKIKEEVNLRIKERTEWLQKNMNYGTNIPKMTFVKEMKNGVPLYRLLDVVVLDKSDLEVYDMYSVFDPDIPQEKKVPILQTDNSSTIMKYLTEGLPVSYKLTKENLESIIAIRESTGIETKKIKGKQPKQQEGSGLLLGLGRKVQAWSTGNHSPILKKEIYSILNKMVETGKLKKREYFEIINNNKIE